MIRRSQSCCSLPYESPRGWTSLVMFLLTASSAWDSEKKKLRISGEDLVGKQRHKHRGNRLWIKVYGWGNLPSFPVLFGPWFVFDEPKPTLARKPLAPLACAVIMDGFQWSVTSRGTPPGFRTRCIITTKNLPLPLDYVEHGST